MSSASLDGIVGCDGAASGYGECRFAHNDETAIHFHMIGQGPPLVLLHGFPEFWGVWGELAAQLASDFTVVMPDTRGCNLSTALHDVADYHADRLAGDILAVIKQIGAVQVICVAHDLGGLAAWALAKLSPRSLAGLVLISAPHPADVIAARAKAADETYLDRILHSDGGHLRETEARLFWCQEPVLRHRLRQAMVRSAPDALFAPYRANLNHGCSWASPATFEGPALCIWGGADPHVAPVLMESAMARLADGQSLVLADHGHFLHHTAPLDLAGAIRSFGL